MSTVNKFLPNKANRELLPGFVAFCIAAGGVGLGFLAAAISAPLLGFVAIGVVALGVLAGFVFILRRWWNLLRPKH
jgi:hypothetical protein